MMANQAEEMVSEQLTSKPSKWGRVGILFSSLGIFVLASAFALGFFQLWQINSMVVNKMAKIEAQINKTDTQVVSSQQAITSLQQLSDQTKNMAVRQEQMISEWQVAQKGNLAKWYVAEADYLIKLAQDHLVYLQDIALAKSLLTRASEILQSISDPNLLAIQQSLTTAITELQAIPVIDTTKLYSQLNVLNSQIDQLPLPLTITSNEPKAEAFKIDAASRSWWQASIDKALAALSKIVIVRYNSGNALPLVMPEQKAFLYQNLHAQMENALWAVLHQNLDIYRASIARMTTWVSTYFVQDATQTQNMLKNLQELQAAQLQSNATINLAPTLQLLDEYLRRS